MKLEKVLVYGLCLLSTASIATGCSKNRGNLNTGAAPGSEKTSDGGQPDIDTPVHGFGWGPQKVYFDYDSSALRPDVLQSLERSAKLIKEAPGIIVQIEGHCDERGTQEYNLALGERRAEAVRDHLVKLGVPSDRFVTISYGKEQPAVPGHDETAWAKNRRCEFSRAQK